MTGPAGVEVTFIGTATTLLRHGDALVFNGHEVAVAYDGLAAIERAREFAPDVVLCDVGLPGMDGYDVARAFRAHNELKGIPLIALTGYGTPEDVRRSLAAGFDAHITKPITLDQLVQTIDKLFR